MLVVVVVFGAVAADAASVVDGAAAAPEEFTVPVVGLEVGAAAGRVVRGVGSSGNGFDITPAIISFKPASEFSWRYLYQVAKLSIHSFLFAWNLGSLPANATARA